ncbi:glycosyltransferase family 4 protein [Paenibacillus sp. VCA1]|uniref:glycosyltransferase family 4 protein n=1 Tax=Paenibacillus sp. VCA1 TaxID=3039148 RepID=UPI002870C372|nr:glycosyltransferase family 4 protein [Paenibacillus sp. VCA1]MDR9856672.1 glycosyltransferase family 4 protein [Paenibacillus sp. VCA1]
MNVLFVFYVPSGGMDTLNRLRCKALARYGIQASCLYFHWGAGVQNNDGVPVYITNENEEIRRILDAGKFDVIVVTTDHKSFPRFRQLGYTGKLVLEIQGYGAQENARRQLTEAVPYVYSYANALLNPSTPHITALFRELFPGIPQYNFPNMFDADTFTYRPGPQPEQPIIAWIGRMEDNKNWREFLHIGHQLSYYVPNLKLWIFDDPNLSIPHEREQFEYMIGQLGLHSRLTIRSNVANTEMQHYYSAIGDSGGFLCNTSKVEGGPLSVLEAMSCRCPVLATNSDGVAIAIRHNETGKNYTVGNIGQAVQEGLDLLFNAPLRESIRTNAQQRLQTVFNPHNYCVSFIDMLYHI